MIRAEGLRVLRGAPGRDRVLALDGVSFEVKAGELVLVLGRTGAGKSTLLEALCGLLPIASGQIALRLDGARHAWGPGETAPRPARSRVGLLFQYPERQIFGATALEDVGWGLGRDGEVAAHRALDRVEIDRGRRSTPLGRLSRGEKRRVALGGILAREPEILLLDEPTVGLDPEGRTLLWREVDAYRRERGVPVVVATHWPRELLPAADRVYGLRAGAPSFVGAPQALSAAARATPWLGQFLPFPDRVAAALADPGRPVPGGAAVASALKDWLAGGTG